MGVFGDIPTQSKVSKNIFVSQLTEKHTYILRLRLQKGGGVFAGHYGIMIFGSLWGHTDIG